MQKQCCEDFLKMFLIGSESTFLDSIDLILMLKCMPNEFVEYNIRQVKLYQLNILQQSIIAYMNDSIVESFEFFDLKNSLRVSNVRDLIMNQKKTL